MERENLFFRDKLISDENRENLWMNLSKDPFLKIKLILHENWENLWLNLSENLFRETSQNFDGTCKSVKMGKGYR